MLLSEEKITPFVRQVLGCQCPLALFDHIESSIEQIGGLEYQRILVGRRLLVYLLPVSPLIDTPERLLGLFSAGVSERNARGYNRIRLALLGEVDSDQAARIVEACLPITAKDEKAHLHFIGRI